MRARHRHVARALHRRLVLRRRARNRYVAVRRQRQIARVRGQLRIAAHTHARCRADHLDLPRRHRTERGCVDRERAIRAAVRRVDRRSRIDCAVRCRAVGRAGSIRGGRRHELPTRDRIDSHPCIQRRVDPDRLADQVDRAHRAFDPRAGAIHARVALDLQMAARHVVADRLRVRVIRRRTADTAQELRRARRQRDADRVRKARAARRDPVRVRDDHRRRRAEHFERAVQQARVAAARRRDLVHDHTRGPTVQVRVRLHVPARQRRARHQAVVQDQPDRVDVEALVLVQRDARRVRRGDVDDGHAAARARRLRDRGLERDRGRRVGNRCGSGKLHRQAHTHRRDVEQLLPCVVVQTAVAGTQHAGRVAALFDCHGDRADEHRRRNERAHRALPPAVLALCMGVDAEEARYQRFRTLARADTRRCRGSQLLQDLTLGRVHFLVDS